MRCWVKSRNERNPRRVLNFSHETARSNREEGGDDVKSAWLLRPGLLARYNGRYRRLPRSDPELILKAGLSSDCRLQLACMKPELLVTAGQHYCGEYVPGPCTHRPSRHGSRQHLKSLSQPQGGRRPRWDSRLGRSRNKVAVAEAAAGSPPF